MDLSIDVAPSQMIGFPFIEWCGAEFGAGDAVETISGPVDATPAACAGAAALLTFDVV